MPCPWLSTMQKQMGAGFYSDVWGPLPFAFGFVPPEQYDFVLVGSYENPSTVVRPYQKLLGIKP
jgi:hypothetical protein